MYEYFSRYVLSVFHFVASSIISEIMSNAVGISIFPVSSADFIAVSTRSFPVHPYRAAFVSVAIFPFRSVTILSYAAVFSLNSIASFPYISAGFVFTSPVGLFIPSDTVLIAFLRVFPRSLCRACEGHAVIGFTFTTSAERSRPLGPDRSFRDSFGMIFSFTRARVIFSFRSFRNFSSAFERASFFAIFSFMTLSLAFHAFDV